MPKLEELRLDAEELKRYLAQAERQKVKDVLSLEIRKIETDIISLEASTFKVQGAAAATQSAPVASKPGCYDVKLTNYAWDQSDKFVKLYVSLTGVHAIPKENVKCDFTAKSVNLVVSALSGKNHSLYIANLLNPIDPDGSHTKVKTDMVIVYMKKKEANANWVTVTAAEKKAKDAKVPKPEPGDDPQASLMTMMKQMYEDGDDDMKRTIAKAWTESREKGGSGFGDM